LRERIRAYKDGLRDKVLSASADLRSSSAT
jgi:hypothetical protein